MKALRFRAFAVVTLVFNLGVIVWGAFVRATGSGAGCGSHWPTCDGQVIPRAPDTEMLIEFTHRATSGLALLLVIGLVVAAWRTFGPGHRARTMAALSLALIVVEALLGAGLVLFGLVADDASVARTVAMPVHLMNTFFLLAALALTVFFAGRTGRLRPPGAIVPVGLLLALASVLLVGITGAIAALGDTLFPAGSLAEGMQRDFAETAHLLERLRVFHPFVAVGAGAILTFVAVGVPARAPRPGVRAYALALMVLFVLQVIVGVVNLALLAPVPLQLLHLLMADLIWVDLVLLAAAASVEPAPAAEEAPPPLPAELAA